MAAAQPFNQTTRIYKDLTLTTLKVMLRTGTTYAGTETALSELDGTEVSGNGWTAGGELIANAAITTVTTDDALLDGDDISITATGGSIGPATSYVIIDDTPVDPTVVAYKVFDTAQEALEGLKFVVRFPNGIIKLAV